MVRIFTQPLVGAAWPLLIAAVAGVAPADEGHIQVDQVVRGSAQFDRDGLQTTIHAADRTIINFRRFNVPAAAGVRFVQPDAASRVLNRITGPDPSVINGTLTANGIVYLVNPAGVIFGPRSVVDVARLYAAAGQISDGDFRNSVDRFLTDGGSLQAHGLIRTADGRQLDLHPGQLVFTQAAAGQADETNSPDPDDRCRRTAR